MQTGTSEKTSASEGSAYKLIKHGGPGPTEPADEIEMKGNLGGGPPQSEDLIQFEFKVAGMTCANCSGNIERKMHGQFDEKEMKSVTIVLLVHKMIAVFPQRVFSSRAVTP